MKVALFNITRSLSQVIKTPAATSLVTIVALLVFTSATFVAVFLLNRYREKTSLSPPNRHKHVPQPKPLPGHPIITHTIQIQNPSKDPPNNMLSIDEKVDLVSQLPSSVIGKRKNEIKQLQTWQLERFEKWANEGNWQKIHDAHYDWWMFPIPRGSVGHGDRFKLSNGDVYDLKNDPEFIQNLRRGATLVLQAWGWDLQKGMEIKPAKLEKGQQWSHWPVRLGKIGDSLKLFRQEDLLNNCKSFCNKVSSTFSPSDNWVKNVFNP